jgi:hypothetical protein
MRPADYLAFYAEHFHTVEVDSTFYACPTVRTVENWNARTPDGFVFSAKVPQTITHDKVLVDCDAELKEFLDTIGILGDKLGPVFLNLAERGRTLRRRRDVLKSLKIKQLTRHCPIPTFLSSNLARISKNSVLAIWDRRNPSGNGKRTSYLAPLRKDSETRLASRTSRHGQDGKNQT